MKTKKAKAKKRTKRRDPTHVLLNLRTTADEYLAIKEIAAEFAGGNVSAWIRQRALQEDPELSADMLVWLKDQKDNI